MAIERSFPPLGIQQLPSGVQTPIVNPVSDTTWAASSPVVPPQDPPRPLSDPWVLPQVHQCCVHPSLPMLGHSSPWVSTLPVPFPSLPPVTISQPNLATPDGVPTEEPRHTALGALSTLPVGCVVGYLPSSPAISHVISRHPSPRPVVVLERSVVITPSQAHVSPVVFSGASMATSPLLSGTAPPSPLAGPSNKSTPRRPSRPPPRFSPVYVTPSSINRLELDGAKFRRLIRLGTPEDPWRAENLSLPFASGLIPRGTLWAKLGHYKKRLQSHHLASRAKDERYAKAEREALNLVMGPGEVRFLQERLAHKKIRADQGGSKAPAKKSRLLSPPPTSDSESGDPQVPST
ncbi:hypothetical protein CHUAL_009908 [Chamberlinius hualienensis]